MYKIRRPRRQGVHLKNCARPKTTNKLHYTTKPARTERMNDSSAAKRYAYLSAHARELDRRQESREKERYMARKAKREELREEQRQASGERWLELQQEINILTVQIYNYENK